MTEAETKTLAAIVAGKQATLNVRHPSTQRFINLGLLSVNAKGVVFNVIGENVPPVPAPVRNAGATPPVSVRHGRKATE